MAGSLSSRRAAVVGSGLIAVAVLTGTLTAASASAARVIPRAGVSGGRRVVTPVAHVRRVPELAVRPQADRRLRGLLDVAMDGAPDAHCLVVSVGDHTIASRNPDRPLVGASNQKILTALAILDAFDPTETFETRVASRPPVDGTIEGDLWVIGGGDPVIDSDTYQASLRFGPTPHTSIEAIADQIVAAGIRRITGSVRGDDSRYDGQRVIPSWPTRYVTQNQVGPLSALALNDGKTFPVIAGTGGTPVPSADPAASFAAGLTELLAVRGVAVAGPPGSGSAPSGLTSLIEVASLPVEDLVAEMLTWSDNNTAELLVKEIGRDATGTGSTEAGLDAVRSALERRGVPIDGVEMVDGSGLDPTNRLSCSAIDAALGEAGPDGELADGLAVAATSGTLRDRFRNGPLAGNLRAKTGTLRGVSALSGWVTSTAGDDLRFSLLLNSGGGELAAAELTAEQRVPAALLSYPDAADPDSLAPLEPRP